MIEYEVVERAGDYVVLQLRGELVADVAAEDVRHALEQHYVDDGVRVIRVDLQPVTYITMEGIQVLLALWRESRNRGKRFQTEGATGQVSHRLRVAGVSKLLDPDS
jgi:anti-anti-sigma factor